MTLADFKGKKNQQVLTSCLNLPNTDLKIKNFKKFIGKNWYSLIEKNITTTVGSTVIPTRGIIPLPKSFKNIISINRQSLFQDFNMHFCCLNMSHDQKISYSHMMDSNGINVTKKIIDLNDLILISVSAFMILNSKVILK